MSFQPQVSLGNRVVVGLAMLVLVVTCFTLAIKGLSDSRELDGSSRTTNGVIARHYNRQRYEYTFKVNGNQFSGDCVGQYNVEQPVEIEYVPGHESVSRVKGTSQDNLNYFMLAVGTAIAGLAIMVQRNPAKYLYNRR